MNQPVEPRLAEYVFRWHDQATVVRWAIGLRYFAFYRALGGHANDGDLFRVEFRYADGAGLLNKLAVLGVVPPTFLPDAPRIEPGRAYPGDTMPPSRIPGHEDRGQPGWVTVAGDRVFVYVYERTFGLWVSGSCDRNDHEVTEDDYRVCQRLEAEFDRLQLATEVDRTREASSHCINRRNYPELFEEAS